MASLALLLRSRSYAAGVAFSTETRDGVRLVGTRVGGDGPTIVFCHGLLGWHRKERIVRFVGALARRFVVYAPDLRGHGASGGVSTYGDREAVDVEAVVGLARRERPDAPLATVGVSMGGVAVLRHAATFGGIDAVAAISTPARWEGHTSRGVRGMAWLGSTPAGGWAARAVGVRLSPLASWREDPEALVERISPTPLLIVHGRDDHFFDEEEAWRLYRRAREPKRLLLAGRFGHAEDGLTPRFADLLADRLLAAIAQPHAQARSRVERV